MKDTEAQSKEESERADIALAWVVAKLLIVGNVLLATIGVLTWSGLAGSVLVWALGVEVLLALCIFMPVLVYRLTRKGEKAKLAAARALLSFGGALWLANP